MGRMPTSPKPVSPEDLRCAMRQWTTGVTVVTAHHEGVSHGMTVNSFTSISLDPPLVLVSLERSTRTHDLVSRACAFGVTILSQEQRGISDTFAGRHTEQSDRFAGLETFTLQSGTPLITAGLSHFDCHVVATYVAGTHTVFIGEVLALNCHPGDPLLYYDRGYRELAP